MVLGGLARLNGQKVVVIGYWEDISVGSIKTPASEGYRKSIRLMNLAETFGKPVVLFIDIQKFIICLYRNNEMNISFNH